MPDVQGDHKDCRPDLPILQGAGGERSGSRSRSPGVRLPSAPPEEEIFLAEAAEDREAFTQSTLVRPDELEREIEQIRESGVAWNREEWIPGLFVVAAPVRVSGRMIGSVAIALPSSRRHELGEALLEGEVRMAAKRISERLSGQRTDSLRRERRADG